ncbi:hypothetical protein LWC34_48040 [Kibdelosporangium philippinense]|uniref:Uncharacterized protein n=1 Tax=Kibdelosporangium philippinense TaxID=211113 RepID=A0ABS8ZVS0_9PSEU|nr:hypothetical protein [Kibdelosporangium philippinense]MCE7010503.1 hypothetical protein [Kibdelosporangium philippinense]
MSVERLRAVLASFPDGLAYEMSELAYDPSSHVYEWPDALPTDYKRLMEGFGPLVLATVPTPRGDHREHEALARAREL